MYKSMHLNILIPKFEIRSALNILGILHYVKERCFLVRIIYYLKSTRFKCGIERSTVHKILHVSTVFLIKTLHYSRTNIYIHLFLSNGDLGHSFFMFF